MEESNYTPKKVYVEFEMLEHAPMNANDASIYPHNGVYLLVHDDGVLSVVYVEKDNAKTFLQQFYETCIGSKPICPVDSVVHVNEVKSVEERFKKTIDSEKRRLDDEYEKRRMELEHEYEIKKLKLEQEMPKRFEQGEWVSGQTLVEIVKTLTMSGKN